MAVAPSRFSGRFLRWARRFGVLERVPMRGLPVPLCIRGCCDGSCRFKTLSEVGNARFLHRHPRAALMFRGCNHIKTPNHGPGRPRVGCWTLLPGPKMQKTRVSYPRAFQMLKRRHSCRQRMLSADRFPYKEGERRLPLPQLFIGLIRLRYVQRSVPSGWNISEGSPP